MGDSRQATPRWVLFVAATMLRHPEKPKWRVEPTTLSVTAIQHPYLTRKTLLLLLRIQRYRLHVANHNATVGTLCNC